MHASGSVVSSRRARRRRRESSNQDLATHWKSQRTRCAPERICQLFCVSCPVRLDRRSTFDHMGAGRKASTSVWTVPCASAAFSDCEKGGADHDAPRGQSPSLFHVWARAHHLCSPHGVMPPDACVMPAQKTFVAFVPAVVRSPAGASEPDTLPDTATPFLYEAAGATLECHVCGRTEAAERRYGRIESGEPAPATRIGAEVPATGQARGGSPGDVGGRMHFGAHARRRAP